MTSLLAPASPPKPKASRALVTQEDRERRIAARREKRGSDRACTVVRQDALDLLNDEITRWAAYIDQDGNGPSQTPQKYFMAFRRMAYSALNLDQSLKPEELTQQEQIGLAAVFDATALVLRDYMGNNKSRAKTKVRYKLIIAEVGSAHRTIIELSRAGCASLDDQEDVA